MKEEFKYVVDNSKYVSINQNEIEGFIKSLGDINYSHWSNELNLDLSNYKAIAIDLTRRYVSPLQTINGKTSIIKMTYFNRDALYILEKDV